MARRGEREGSGRTLESRVGGRPRAERRRVDREAVLRAREHSQPGQLSSPRRRGSCAIERERERARGATHILFPERPHRRAQLAQDVLARRLADAQLDGRERALRLVEVELDVGRAAGWVELRVAGSVRTIA